MELSLITPIAFLPLSTFLPGRFCLANIAQRSEEYKEFFTFAADTGYNVILDNGIFEKEQVNEEALIQLASEIGAKIVVAPDIIGSPALENWERAKAFIQFAQTKLSSRTEYMFVPQCQPGDLTGFKNVMELAILSTKVQWLGICRYAVQNAFQPQLSITLPDEELLRIIFSQEFLTSRYDILNQNKTLYELCREHQMKIHFLAMGDLPDLIQYHWYVDSMDTASPFRHAWYGSMIEESNRYEPSISVSRTRDYFLWDIENEPHYNVLQTCLHQSCLRLLEFAKKAETTRDFFERRGH